MHPSGWISPYEHSAVREPALAKGYAIGAGEGLPCQMAVNNETGLILPTLPGSLCDATQALGKTPWTAGDCAFALGSGHKLYGPKGIGFVYARDGTLAPLLQGGEQEGGRRAGTLNVPGIVGLGEACRIAREETEPDAARIAELREVLLDELGDVPDWRVNAPGVPHILSLSFRGIEAEPLLIELDARGFAASAGAACSSRSTEPSHVLAALGLEPEWLRGTLRVSFGKANTVETTRALARAIRGGVERLRRLVA